MDRREARNLREVSVSGISFLPFSLRLSLSVCHRYNSRGCGGWIGVMVSSSPTTAPVRIVALGGLGEIGLNLMAIECAGRAIVIDCGVMFPDEPALGMGTYIPEMAWLERSHVAIEAAGLPHSRRDSISGVGRLLRRFNVP